MFDPTEFAIIATFSAAFCIFTVTASAKAWLTKSCGQRLDVSPSQEVVDSPFQSPKTLDLPPELPVGRVPIWFYRRVDLLGIAFVFGVFFALVATSVGAVGGDEVIIDAAGLVISIAFQFMTAGMVTALVIGRVGLVEWLGLKWSSGWLVLLIAPGAVLGMWLFFGGLQVAGFMKWIESFGVEAVQDTVKLLQESNDPVILGLMVVAAVVVAPFCEEIVFRGYLYAASKKFAGPWAAGACSALVFAAAHGSLAALLPLFVFGCVLALIYEKTGSIWAPIAVHFCFNGATVLVQVAARFYQIPLEGAL